MTVERNAQSPLDIMGFITGGSSGENCENSIPDRRQAL